MILQKLAAGLEDHLIQRAEKYLKAFGYIKAGVDDLEQALKDAQTVLGVTPSGVLNIQTLKAMEFVPRCGRPDVLAVKGEATGLNQWLKSKAATGITYRVVGFVNGIPRQQQLEAIAECWTRWEKWCNITVIQTDANDESADITIDASASRREEFGVAGNVLAWCELPQGNSFTGKLMMKFDLAETWILSGGRGILFINVGCHEFGHALGLEHTNIRGELMYPTYDEAIGSPQDKYDIPQARTRYGRNPSPPDNPPPSGADEIVNGIIITVKNKPYRLVPA